MRGNDAPAFGRAHPGLALAAGFPAPRAHIFYVRRPKVATISGDNGARRLSLRGPALLCACLAISSDLLSAVEIFSYAVADGERVAPEQANQTIRLVGQQRTLVFVELRRQPPQYFWNIDLHVPLVRLGPVLWPMDDASKHIG